jgi:four helix bundle protein
MQTFDTNVMERMEDYALRVIRLFSTLPDYPEPGYQVAQTLGKQLLRSGTSVGANFAESTRTHSTPDKVAKQQICVKELAETAYWLRLLVKADIVPPERMHALLTETDELLALCISSIKRLRQS